ncbi:MAG TPA: hypothetical protein VN541_12555, partial [Tepidisphaeraceae bacterium]|nr:hypothetical protein [Tepidisphaeraceae bacterium]
MPRSRLAIFASPALCLALLGGIVAEDRTHLKPSDVEPYHAAAKQAIKAWPETIVDGNWTTSVDDQLPAAAEQLLHPNCVIDRLYTSGSIRVNGQPVQASLLIVQCKDSRDMAGHYPPICYPASGEPELSESVFNLNVNGTMISGKEYHFLRKSLPVFRRCVYDFFILPGMGFRRDMGDLNRAAKDYQRRYYGAAQFQVVMDADYPQEIRESIFKKIIGADTQALTVLNTV